MGGEAQKAGRFIQIRWKRVAETELRTDFSEPSTATSVTLSTRQDEINIQQLQTKEGTSVNLLHFIKHLKTPEGSRTHKLMNLHSWWGYRKTILILGGGIAPL